MNLDELERLYKAATPGEWLLSDVDIPPIVYLGAQNNEAMIACVDAGAGYANLPVNEAEANAKSIAALHNAFPALLALARDGERYREAAKGVWVLTREVNAYDQEGEYFVAVFMSKPTAEQLSKHGVPTNRIESVLRNEGRVDNDDDWHFLRFEQDAARKGEK